MDIPCFDEHRQPIEVDSDSESGKAGWARLDSGCVAAYAIEGPMATGEILDQHSAERSDSLLACEDVEYVADTAEGTPS